MSQFTSDADEYKQFSELSSQKGSISDDYVQTDSSTMAAKMANSMPQYQAQRPNNPVLEGFSFNKNSGKFEPFKFNKATGKFE